MGKEAERRRREILNKELDKEGKRRKEREKKRDNQEIR